MAQRWKFGIIGCGQIAWRHAKEINRNNTLVAVCDIAPEKAGAVASTYNCKAYTSLETLLNTEAAHIDIMVVCSPNGLHAIHAVESLKAGCHVLCEKPMAIAVTDCRQMIEIALQHNRHLFIVKQNRFNPPVEYVKRLLDSGKLGKIYSFQVNCFWNRPVEYYRQHSWRGTLHLDGGPLFTQFSHFIDIINWFFDEATDIQAFFANYAHPHSIAFEDTGSVLLHFKSGISGTLQYTLNSYQKNKEGSLTVFGEKGTVKIGGQYLNELEYQVINNEELPLLPASGTANNYGFYQGSMSNHDKVYDNLIDVLEGRSGNTVSPEEGMKTVQMIEAIYSLRHLPVQQGLPS